MKGLTDEEVRQQIEELKNDEFVRLARKEERVRNRERQYLYQLRSWQKRGKELANAGITYEMLENSVYEVEDDDD